MEIAKYWSFHSPTQAEIPVYYKDNSLSLQSTIGSTEEEGTTCAEKINKCKIILFEC